jgi:8-oxo-dGTP diphosphatase
MPKHIHVAAGVILNAQREVLLALRPRDKHQGGLWEFPGGKVEAGETVRQALARELLEEINLTVLETSHLLVVDHDYGDKQVKLEVLLVTQHSGIAEGREGQDITWVQIDQLHSYAFPEANAPIVKALQELSRELPTTEQPQQITHSA